MTEQANIAKQLRTSKHFKTAQIYGIGIGRTQRPLCYPLTYIYQYIIAIKTRAFELCMEERQKIFFKLWQVWISLIDQPDQVEQTCQESSINSTTSENDIDIHMLPEMLRIFWNSSRIKFSQIQWKEKVLANN